jgi:hypothetical protein
MSANAATQATSSYPLKKIVMARFMRATHGNKRDVSVGGPDVKLVLRSRFARSGGRAMTSVIGEKNCVTWVARIRGP